MGRPMKRLLSPKVLIPTILTLAFFAFLIGLTRPRKLLRALILPPATLTAMLGLTILYMGIKGLAWGLFLRRLGIQARPGEIAFCFCGSEITKSLPGGVYFQNYLLSRVSDAPFSYSAGASLALVVMEGVVSYLALLAMGLPYLPWLREALLLLGMLIAIVIWLGQRYAWTSRLVAYGNAHGHRQIQQLAIQVAAFFEGIGILASPWMLLIGGLLVAGYLGAMAAMLYLVGLHLPVLWSVAEAVRVLAFSIFIPLLVPSPVHVGFTEISGVGALVGAGLKLATAIAIILSYRVWSQGLSMGFGLLGMLAMPRKLARALGKPPR